MTEHSNTEGLSHLGSGHTAYTDQYDPSLLECFDNRFPEHSYEVKLDCPEFTALCPMTSQPDFGRIEIVYSPNEKLVESKSLKLYLFSFRNAGSFHEDCVNKIAKDLGDLMKPHWIRVTGHFNPRGGIAIIPTVTLTYP